ncbi:MAG: ABC transporter substrate-binding protein [Candidatus Paceibacterota bacterium]|jgi:peptide/nickel transport system substrate-binding protein
MIRPLINVVKSFSTKERLVFIGSFVVLVVCFVLLLSQIIATTTLSTAGEGGTYIEGVVGQPSFINPVLAKPNTPDRDLVALTFASVKDISENIKNDKSFKTWTIRIKENARWQDETPITSDDIIFTVQTIQNPDTLSPLFSDWQNIKVSRISEREVEFSLPGSYALFDSLLKELRPIPKKIFADLSASNIKLSIYNLEPFVSGPFAYKSLDKKKDGFITEYELERNDAYRSIGRLPNIDNFVIKFFENEDSLIKEYNLGTIDGFLKTEGIATDRITINSSIEKIPTNKYYALFINPNANKNLASKNLRTALASAINISSIITDSFDNYATAQKGPLPSTVNGYSQNIENYTSFDQELSKKILEEIKWKYNEDSLTITIPSNDLLKSVAQKIKDDWQAVGIQTKIKEIDPQTINEDVIKTRNYEILLFGNISSATPDLFSFWHSSQKFYPGLNLSLYENSTVDSLLESLRKIAEYDSKRIEKLEEIQKIISGELSAIFLVSPQYLYIHKTSRPGIIIKTISLPEDRFSQITDWYVKTKRIFK